MGDGRDLMQRIAAAGGRMDAGLSDRDVERLVTGARRRRERRATLLRAVIAAGATTSLVLAVALTIHQTRRRPAPESARPAPSAPDPAQVVRLSDGSTATALDLQTRIELVGQQPDRVELSLVRGRGQFQVTPRPRRAFVVRAGDVTVSVVGTVFTVERVADRVGVAVQRGTVRVDWGAGFALVTAGQSGWYPPLVAPPDRASGAPATARAPRGPRAKTASRAAALEAGREDAAALLLAADRARLTGHPENGAELLRKLLREQPGDPRAPLAAFTLGRLLLMELHRPADAADAFAQARRLSPGGPFAEDALAREVESLSQAGRAAEARARAQEYQHLYPNGRRTATVRTAAGIK